MSADIRAFLETRTASPAGFNADGTRLLVSSDLPGTAQAFRLDLPPDATLPDEGTPVEALLQLTGESEPVGASYLPTADRLLVVRDEAGNERHQLFTADDAPPHGGPVDLQPLVVDPDVIHRPGGMSRDGRLLAYSSNRRTGTDFDVWIRDLHTGREELVHAPGGWTGAAGFSPDGRHVALWELTDRPGDNRSLLHDRRDGTVVEIEPHDRLDPSAVGSPSWLPDGSAFYLSSDVGRDQPVICRGTVRDGRVRTEPVLDVGWPCACAVDWAGRRLLVVWNEHGYTRARLHDPRTLAPLADVPLPGDGVASGFFFSRDGRRLAFGFSSARIPGDAWIVDVDTVTARRATRSPTAVDPARCAPPERVEVPSFDGLAVPAFVYRPERDGRPERDERGPAARSPAPVVVTVHGGPESQYRPGFAPLTQYLVANGFAVVAPNVRGSTGYGKRYQHLDDVDRRLDAVADLAAIHDWIATQPDLDASRVALHGGSYGGYMTLAGLAFSPERWAGGVSIVGISDLVTFLRNTADWRRRFREREYGSLEHHREVLEAASPIGRIDAIRAPLLLVHGANDPRVPLSEAEQIHAGLRERGVRCELLVYPDEGHGLAKLANRIDAYPRVVAFLRDVLAKETPDGAPVT